MDARLSQVASVLARFGTQVHCWSHADWKRNVEGWARRLQLAPLGPWAAYTSGTLGPWHGYATKAPRAINLSPNLCAQLKKLEHPLASVRGRESDAFAWSIAALAHEAMHVAGISNEAEAACYGMQAVPRVAVRLGLTAADGEFLARRYWERWHPWITPVYRSAECRNGGRLDLHPETDAWP